MGAIDTEGKQYLSNPVFFADAFNYLLEVELGGVDMCKAQEKNNLKREVTGAIMGMRKLGASDDSIIAAVMEMFNVTKEYVLALLAPKQA